jgi:phage terminase large subunit
VRLELTDTSEWLVAKVPLIKQYPSFADSARPETISMMAKTIQLMRGAKKWSGSVEDGVTFLQGFDEIVVHPECQADTLSELRSYSYKVDKNDLVTKVILDTNNHYADSMRYGLSPKIVNANDLGFLEFAQSEMIRLGKKE